MRRRKVNWARHHIQHPKAVNSSGALVVILFAESSELIDARANVEHQNYADDEECGVHNFLFLSFLKIE
jgi:hypothetical protein